MIAGLLKRSVEINAFGCASSSIFTAWTSKRRIDPLDLLYSGYPVKLWRVWLLWV